MKPQTSGFGRLIDPACPDPSIPARVLEVPGDMFSRAEG